MESEEVMTSSVTSNSSDNESWTIIEDEDENPLVQARIDVIQAVAEFSKKSVENHESESDIEPIEEAETNLESLTSDGIPVGEELSGNGDQYLWSSEGDLTSSTETVEAEPKKKSIPDSLCPSGYPPFELMDRFAEIKKGRTYSHQPNPALNLYLSGTLVIVFALVMGLGFGHFKVQKYNIFIQEKMTEFSRQIETFILIKS